MEKQTKKRVQSLIDYRKELKASGELENFAKACGTTPTNLRGISYGGAVSAKLAKKIKEESKGKVSLKDLLPEIF